MNTQDNFILPNKTNVVQYLFDTKERFPNKIAIEDKNGSTSYTQFVQQALNISSNILTQTTQVH
ncbi:hypothetical protein CQA66_09055, partial [Helicobacter aurati]